MRRLSLVAPAIAVLLLAVACSGSADGESEDPGRGLVAESAQAAEATPPPTAAPTPSLAPAAGGTGAGEVAAPEPTTDEFLAFSIAALTGEIVLKAEVAGDGRVSISYEQPTDAAEADLLSRWINMAMVAMTFMDAPATVTIIPVTDGSEVARVVVPSGILGEVLNGERSLEQAIAAIEIADR